MQMYVCLYVCTCTGVQMRTEARRKLELQVAVSLPHWAASTVNDQAFSPPLLHFFLKLMTCFIC